MLDENVQISLASLFRERGHEVLFVLDVCGQGAIDPVVAAAAHEKNSVLVTYNEKHFRHLISRNPSKPGRGNIRASMIALCCLENLAEERLRSAMRLIEFEFRCQLATDHPRLIVRIGESYVKFDR